jgi:hypothetical protein
MSSNNNTEVIDVDENQQQQSIDSQQPEQLQQQQSNPNGDYEILCTREKLIQDLFDKISTDSWGFQKQTDIKARNHLRFLLLDKWSKKRHKKALDDKAMMKKLDGAVRKCWDEMMYEYGKWCSVTGRKNRIGSSTVDKTTAMLLLLIVFGEIDLVRTQNHVCQLLFHLAYKLHLKITKKPELAKPYALEAPVDDQSNTDDAAAKKKKKSRPTATLSTKPVSTIAEIVVREAKYCYELVKVHFNKNIMNEEFFDWDDLNDLSWTPGFVAQFFKRAQKDSVFSIGGFDRAFRMKNYPMVVKVMNTGTVHYDDKEALKKEKLLFNRKWKTYMDRAGGWLGLKGYITFFLNFYPPVYYQLLCMTIAFAWFFQFSFYWTPEGETTASIEYLNIGITAAPLVLAGLYLICSLLFYFWTSPSIRHAHRFSIPRRDKASSRPQRMFAWRFLNIVNYIPNFILSIFHRHHIAATLVVMVMTAAYIVVMRWVIFESVSELTNKNLSMVKNSLMDAESRAGLSPTQIANIAFVLVSFILLWVSIMFVCSIMPPIIFSVCAGILGFVKGWWIGSNRIKTWKQMSKYFRKDALLQNFKKKMLGENSALKKDEKAAMEAKWAVIWNSVIDDFYENHQCSKNEKVRLSFKLQTEKDGTTKVTGIPDLSTKPLCEDMTYHLIRFINNLHQNMPHTEVKVIDMKRLAVVTPVYREKVFYSWDELVETTNTSQSFLKCLITKYPHDWKNFKDKEFQHGTRLRKTVEYIEFKVMSGEDITCISHKKFTVTQHLKSMIQSWASQRFQPVSRTIKGFMKVPKALSILLKLQNPELNDEQVRKIVRQKFTYMIGAQLYDETVWKAATGYDRLPTDSAKRENEQEFREFIDGLNYLSKTVGDNMLKIAYVKQVKVKKENSDEYEKKYRGVLTIHEDGVPVNVYDVDAFGDFSQVGQGKPTNQGFTAQFFDASYIQAVDCNMDSTLTQSFIVPNVLKEFDLDKKVKIVGCPEYIFTSSWSQFGYAAAFTERVFGSMIQRVWSMIGLRMHYGHPDFLRGLFVMFTTGMSKLSYISEDVFLGFDTILNKGKSIQVDYFEVGKARDVDAVTTTKFNRKIAMGAAQLACSRYPTYLLSSPHLTFFDKLLFTYSVVSHYSNTLFTILAIFTLYTTRLIIMILITIILRYFKVDKKDPMYQQLDYVSGNISLVADSMYLFQMGMALAIPGIFYMVLEKGLVKGLKTYVEKLVVLLIYSMFQLMNIGISFHQGMRESAKYLASGRGTGLQHRTAREVYSIFKETHFYPAGLMLALVAVGIITGGSPYYLVFHGVLIMIWVLSPTVALPQLPALAKSIAPWRSGYQNENRQNYDDLVEQGRIMSGQRAFWLSKKTTKQLASMPSSQQPIHVYTPLDNTTVERMNQYLSQVMENKELYESLAKISGIFTLDDVESMKELYTECSTKVELLGRNNVQELAALCSDYLFMNKESSQKIFRMSSSKKGGNDRAKHLLILTLAQYDMFPYYCEFVDIVKKAILKVDHILAKEMDEKKASDCIHELIEAGCSIIMDRHQHFEKLLFTGDKALRDMKSKTSKILSQLSNKAISISKQCFIQAQKEYEDFIGEASRRKVFSWPELVESNRVHVLSSLQYSLNFAKRLTESRSDHEHIPVSYFVGTAQGSQILTCDAFEDDNGSSIFDQMLPILVNDALYENLSDNRRKEIKHETKHLLRCLTDEVREKLMENDFLELEATCQDMFELLEKGEHVLKRLQASAASKKLPTLPVRSSSAQEKSVIRDNRRVARLVPEDSNGSTSNSRVT